MNERPQRGGKRAGAGRPPSSDKREQRSIRLPPTVWAWIEREAARRGTSQGKVIEAAIDKERDERSPAPEAT